MTKLSKTSMGKYVEWVAEKEQQKYTNSTTTFKQSRRHLNVARESSGFLKEKIKAQKKNSEHRMQCMG